LGHRFSFDFGDAGAGVNHPDDDHGFDKTSTAELRRRLEPLVRKTQPYSKRIAHKGVWVEPKLLAEIEYRAKSAEGKVRHPFFKGLREDL
jgi:bifunctional non-homologous end joining protein LigD